MGLITNRAGLGLYMISLPGAATIINGGSYTWDGAANGSTISDVNPPQSSRIITHQAKIRGLWVWQLLAVASPITYQLGVNAVLVGGTIVQPGTAQTMKSLALDIDVVAGDRLDLHCQQTSGAGLLCRLQAALLIQPLGM